MEKVRYGIIMSEGKEKLLHKAFFDTPEELKEYVHSDEAKVKYKQAEYIGLRCLIDETEADYEDRELLQYPADANVDLDLNYMDHSVDKLVDLVCHGYNYETRRDVLSAYTDFYYVLIIRRTDIPCCEYRQRVNDLATANEALRLFQKNEDILKYLKDAEYKVEVAVYLEMVGLAADPIISIKEISNNCIREMRYEEFKELSNVLEKNEDGIYDVSALADENEGMNSMFQYVFEDFEEYEKERDKIRSGWCSLF